MIGKRPLLADVKSPASLSREMEAALCQRVPEQRERATEGVVASAELLSVCDLLPKHCLLRLEDGPLLALSPRLLARLGFNEKELYSAWNRKRDLFQGATLQYRYAETLKHPRFGYVQRATFVKRLEVPPENDHRKQRIYARGPQHIQKNDSLRPLADKAMKRSHSMEINVKAILTMRRNTMSSLHRKK